ncbi:hypothetical protein [Ruminococcus flavefaciens]|uniref:hypothetical protein n=1 Tax=Ruminococcus flavefaciens TaxID=1265 RepID=UPI00048C72AF|nr:hypothetical protein [Ruminococcus flavefaciens]
MQKKTAKIINSIISAVLTIAIMLSECLIAYAADGSENSKVSKGLIIFVMTAVFIVTAVITGFISFRMKKNKIRKTSAKDSSENKQD